MTFDMIWERLKMRLNPVLAASAAGFSTDDECLMERVVLELAVAAHSFETGEQSGSEADLIEARLIDLDLEGVAVADGVIVPVADEPCRELPEDATQMSRECFDAAFRLMTAISIYTLHAAR